MKDKKIKITGKLGRIICLIIYRLLLDRAYFNIIHPFYLYEGFADNRNIELLILSWVCLILSMIVINKIFEDDSERVSPIVIVTLYLISYVPFTTCIYAGILSYGYIVANNIYWLILICAEKYSLKRHIKSLKPIRFGNLKIDDWFVKIIGVFSFLLVIFISAKYTHFRLNFNMFNVYNLRNEVSGYNLPTIVEYLFDWTKAINPILLAYCLLKGNYLMATVYFISQMFSFGIDGLKSTFFLSFAVVLGVFLYNKITPKKMKYLLITGFTGISALGIIEYIIFKSYFIIQLFVRRMEFTTNYIANCYFDFFSKNTPDYFRASFLRHFGFVSPYTLGGESIGEVIASQYYRSDVNFNNGLISDAMTNLGYVGVILMPIVVILILRLYDRSAFGLDRRLTIASALYLTLIILSTFMTTVLLTHGLLVLILLLSMMNREQFDKKNLT